MKLLFIIAIVIAFLVVAIAIYKNKDIPESISEISYIIPRPIYSIWMALIAIFIAPYLIEQYPFLGFVTCISLIGVAVSGLYKTQLTAFHYTCGWIAAIAMQIITFLVCPYILLFWLLYLFVKSKYVFWAEIFTFIQLVFI